MKSKLTLSKLTLLRICNPQVKDCLQIANLQEREDPAQGPEGAKGPKLKCNPDIVHPDGLVWASGV